MFWLDQFFELTPEEEAELDALWEWDWERRRRAKVATRLRAYQACRVWWPRKRTARLASRSSE
jgi:hypothetical protein